MLQIVGSLIGGIGSAVSGFFGLKQAQVNTVHETIRALNEANTSSADKEAAISNVIMSEAGSGYWLAAVWRPLIMVFFSVLVGMYFFGYTTPNLMQPMPANSIIAEVFEILKTGIMGYMPLRTVEKIASQINIGRIISKLLDKKI